MAKELYEMLNGSYHDFITKLCGAFAHPTTPNPIKALNTELAIVERLLGANPQTDRIYKRISGGLKPIVDSIYEKDMKIFKRNPDAERIALFECAHLYEIVPRMQPQEMEILWTVLENLAQPLSTIGSTAKYLDSFTDIARCFISKNPDASEKDTRSRLFSQMLTDPTLCAKTAKFFQEGDLASMKGDFANVLKGFGLTAGATKKQTESEVVIEEVKNPEPQVSIHVDNTKTGPAGFAGSEPAPSPEPGSLEAMFAEMEMKDADITSKTAKHRSEKKNPLAAMVEFMEDKQLSPEQIVEMKEIAKKTLGDDAHSEDKIKMQRVFELFGSSNPNPEAIANELRNSCGGSEEDTSMFMNMFSQLKSSNPLFTKSE